MDKLIVKIEKYNQKGEGVAFIQQKPIYIFGSIKDEVLEINITKDNKTYYIGKINKIIKKSPNRVENNIENAHQIGGYELIHMNDIEQKNFKIERLKNDLKKISKITIEQEQIEYFESPKKIKYRNKITLHNGSFYKKNSRESIEISDYLLSDIKYDKTLQGEIIYRKLDTLIFGTKKDKKYTTDSMLDYKFRIGLNSFYQINKDVAEEVYKEIQKNIIINGNTLDLYSGIGIIAIIASAKSNKVIGIEWNKNSYLDALYNIKNNNISNIVFYCEDVQKYISRFNFKEQIDTLILDPSRQGIGSKTIKNILDKIKPKRIIYLSCNPGTQASDLYLLKTKYKISKIKIYDMFPQTYHIESLVILDKLN